MTKKKSAARRQRSGAQKRQRARAKKLEALRAAAAELGVHVLETSELEAQRRAAASGESTSSERLQRSLALIGPPSLEATSACAYAAQTLIALLDDVLHDPALDERERRKLASDIAWKAGATYSRALQQQKLKEVAERLAPADEEQNGARSEPISPEEWERAGRRTRVQPEEPRQPVRAPELVQHVINEDADGEA